MEDLNLMLCKNIVDYEVWLKRKGVNPDKFRSEAKKNECIMMLRAFRRARKNWDLTKTQRELIKKYRD